MAGLDAETSLPIPLEIDQLRAIVELRWRLFTRAMRNDNAKISFALWLTGRIALFCLAVVVGGFSGFLAYIGCDRGGARLSGIFILVMLGWQGLSLLRDPQAGGIESELSRFPLRLRTYIGLWLASGALDGMTILGTWACIGIYVGLLFAHANPLRSGASVLLFLLCNLLLSRMVTLWLGRMLARRRTRELILVLASMIGILPRLLLKPSQKILHMLHRLPLPPVFFRAAHFLPPAFAARAAYGDQTNIALPFAGLLLCDAAFAAALIIGLRRSFRGEHLQEFAAASTPTRLTSRTANGTRDRLPTHPAFLVAQMEWARLRHGGMTLYATLTPLLYVALFGTRLARTAVGLWTLPIVAAYLGLALRSFNVFGSDGPGVQTFMLAPVPLRAVMLGKNLFAATIYIGQLVASVLLVAFVVHRVSPPALIFTAVWVAGHMAISFSVGNTRSVRAPAPVATRTAVRGASSGGGWVALLCMFSASLIGGLIVIGCTWWHHPWIAPLAMLPFTVAALIWYRRSLDLPMLQGDITAMEPLGLIVAKIA